MGLLSHISKSSARKKETVVSKKSGTGLLARAQKSVADSYSTFQQWAKSYGFEHCGVFTLVHGMYVISHAYGIDSQTIAQSGAAKANEVTVGTSVASVMSAFEHFVKIQSDAALRQVAGQFAYDDTDSNHEEVTLRGGGTEINELLERTLDERLAMAGIEIVEARINYLAYAPEIAAVMLRRQQASAIITAREKIVEGAVSMVKMALDKLSAEGVVELDDDKKAAMVSNLLVVLCGDDTAQPVVNTGTLNH